MWSQLKLDRNGLMQVTDQVCSGLQQVENCVDSWHACLLQLMMWSQLKLDKIGLMQVTDQGMQAKVTAHAVKDMEDDITVASEHLA